MPPKIQYSKADLLHAAFRITRARGLDAVNARAIARELGCSTQPIFRAFRSMDEVRGEMLRMGMDAYGLYISRSNTPEPKRYLRSGMAYVQFAMEEPELFKLLFMRDRVSDGTLNQDNRDRTQEYVMSLVMESTSLSREEAEAFHTHLWIYTHGMASMLATKYLVLGMDEVEQKLREGYISTRRLYGLPSIPEDALYPAWRENPSGATAELASKENE